MSPSPQSTAFSYASASVAAAALLAAGAAGAGLAVVLQRTLLKYKPPKVWRPAQLSGKFGGINSHTAGPRSEAQLPKGIRALQLHSMATPNGVKVTALLEELVIRYGKVAEYDAYSVSILKGEQFTAGFVAANPNSKIPALLHYKDGLSKPPIRVFESAAILVHLCEHFDTDNAFLPAIGDPLRAECLSWIFWVQGSAPYLGGGFGHFFAYAPTKQQYPIDRFAMEVKRQLDVLERHLSGAEGSASSGGPYLCGEKYTAADICAFPWYGGLFAGIYPGALEFLALEEYPSVAKWVKLVGERKAMKRGKMVNKFWGPEEEQLPERHGVDDFEKLEGEKKSA